MSRTASYERQRNPHATQQLTRTTATHEPIRNPHVASQPTRCIAPFTRHKTPHTPHRTKKSQPTFDEVRLAFFKRYSRYKNSDGHEALVLVTAALRSVKILLTLHLLETFLEFTSAFFTALWVRTFLLDFGQDQIVVQRLADSPLHGERYDV